MIDIQVAGKRIFKRFASMADAEVEAATLRDQRDYEGRAGFLLPADIRAAALRCMERLHPFNATIEQAVDYFVAHKLRYLEKPTVDTGVKTILAELDGKRGVRTVDILRWYWTRFAAEFGSLKFSEVEPVRITS